MAQRGGPCASVAPGASATRVRTFGIAFGRLGQGLCAAVRPEVPDLVSFSRAAQFVEVRVESHTRRISVPRAVSVMDPEPDLVTVLAQRCGVSVLSNLFPPLRHRISVYFERSRRVTRETPTREYATIATWSGAD
jgi:hypothetical protein